VIRPNDITDFRGGARLVFTARDVTYSLAHYYTYLDTPGVRFIVPGPQGGSIVPNYENPIIAEQITPRVAITGGSLTFPVPSWYTIVRSEAAYIQGEGLNRQGRGNPADSGVPANTPQGRRLASENNIEGGLNPFVFPGFFNLTRKTPIVGQILQRNTFNYVIGLDVNRYVRWLNPTQTLFFSTQVFYKHIFDSPGDLVLPTPHHNLPANGLPLISTLCGNPPSAGRACNLIPRFYKINDNQFLQTLLVSTSYYGGRVNPQLSFAYDWQGVILAQPGVTLVRDPFRLVMDYTFIEGPPTATIGTLRDRDNVRFQMEYVF
jgi:hypothetical protein